MTKVDFYLLDRHVAEGRLRFACKVCNKAYKLGHRIYVQTPDSTRADQMDTLLWTFDQSAFLPHVLYDPQNHVYDTPVVIGYHDLDPENLEPDAFDVFLSLLDSSVPEHVDQFTRVAEFVDNTDSEKAIARERYRQYRDLGCELETHKVNVV